MNSGLVYLRPSRLTYVRVTGPYETAIPQAWAKLFSWLDKHGMNTPPGRCYGLSRDNPQRMDAAQCRYDACIEMNPLFEERAMRDLGLVSLPAGPYARVRHASGYAGLSTALSDLYGTFKAPPDLRLDDRRPMVTIYLADPRKLEPASLRADVCVPVAAARASREASEAA